VVLFIYLLFIYQCTGLVNITDLAKCKTAVIYLTECSIQ